MKTQTKDLIGPALDWAVDKAMGEREANDPDKHDDWDLLPYHTDWAYGGPIIEREKLSVVNVEDRDEWSAVGYGTEMSIRAYAYRGPTLLIAAMRCYVASKLGDEVSIPKELL